MSGFKIAAKVIISTLDSALVKNGFLALRARISYAAFVPHWVKCFLASALLLDGVATGYGGDIAC
jgi:hypothetical protein